MSKEKLKSSAYIRFLNLVNAISELDNSPKLDYAEQKILHILAINWSRNVDVSVLDCMKLFDELSSATVHRRIQSLLKKNLIKLVLSKEDKRIKTIHPTQKTIVYFENLENCLSIASRL